GKEKTLHPIPYTFPRRILEHENDSMQAQELMRVHIVKARPEDTLREAVDLMDLYQVTGLPVVDATGQLIGMLTERDVMRALLPENDVDIATEDGFEALLARLRQAPELRVEQAMSRPAISIA